MAVNHQRTKRWGQGYGEKGQDSEHILNLIRLSIKSDIEYETEESEDESKLFSLRHWKDGVSTTSWGLKRSRWEGEIVSVVLDKNKMQGNVREAEGIDKLRLTRI